MNEYNFTIAKFRFESGQELSKLTLRYHTWGTLNRNKSNVILIAHALTASSNAAEWWPNTIGFGKVINPENHFIICINSLGSEYGSSNTQSINPETGQAYGLDFPVFSIRDNALLQQQLLHHLEIKKIELGIGASFGGYQVLALCKLGIRFNKLLLISTAMEESTWGRALHSAQRMALEADPSFYTSDKHAGQKGLEAARAIGMLHYRGPLAFDLTQGEKKINPLGPFKVESYLRYQGKKLAERFHAQNYYRLTQCLDSHQLLNDESEDSVIFWKGLKSKSWVVGVKTDILTPPDNQQKLAQWLQTNNFILWDSDYGHDAFLIEYQKLNQLINQIIQAS